MSTEIDKLLERAINNKVRMDELILKSDQIYVCMECQCITNYWKPGLVCGDCELKAERYED